MLWGSLRARRARVALALMAVTLGVAVATALATLALRVGDDLARTLRAAGPNFVALPAGARWPLDVGGATFEPARAGVALGDSAVAALKNTFWKNNVLEATPELTLPVEIEGTRVPLRGTWFHRSIAAGGETWTTGLARLHPTWKVAGRWPDEEGDEIALGRSLARQIGAAPGRQVTIVSGTQRTSALVTGVIAADGFEDRAAWVPLALAQQLAGRPGEVDRVWVSVLVRPAPRGAPPDPVRDPKGYERYSCGAFPANVAKGLGERLAADVIPLSERVAGEERVVERLNLLMLLLGLAAVTASTLGLLSTTAATVVERRTELALLRVLGASSQQLSMLLFGETLLVSLAGGVLGWGLGSLAAAAIRGDTFGSGWSFQPLLLPLALILAAGVAWFGTVGPLRVAIGSEPASELRGHA
jgi:putative ABC transport system permease protein